MHSPPPRTQSVQVADGIVEMPRSHAPVVAHEPFHGAGSHKLHEGELIGLGERLHEIGANVVHGPLLDEGLKEPP